LGDKKLERLAFKSLGARISKTVSSSWAKYKEKRKKIDEDPPVTSVPAFLRPSSVDASGDRYALPAISVGPTLNLTLDESPPNRYTMLSTGTGTLYSDPSSPRTLVDASFDSLQHLGEPSPESKRVDLHQLLRAVRDGDEGQVTAALEANVDPNSIVFRGSTVLHLAASQASPNIMALLLKAKADPNLQDALGQTALHLALKCGEPSCTNEMVQLLLDAGADVSIYTTSGEAVMDIAAQECDHETRRLLAQHLLRHEFEMPSASASSGAITSKLCIKFPFNLTSGPNLCRTIFDAVDSIYELLDKLPNSGFALGFDILSNDIHLVDPLDLEIFSGIFNVVLNH